MLFKKLFRVLVLGGAVVGAHASCNCATGSSAKSGDGTAARGGGADMNAADGGTAPRSESSSSGGGGVMGW